MKKETKVWLEQSKEHKKDAQYCLKGARYGLSLYCYHQALEKIFKAAIIEFVNKVPTKSHQLDYLLKETELSDSKSQWFEELAKITQHFWRIRYPDIRLSNKYSSEEKVKEIVKNFTEIYQWVENKLKNT